MDYRDVDITALAADHPYLRVGLEALENNYRELQHAYDPTLLPDVDEDTRPTRQRVVEIDVAEAAARGAREVLVKQVALQTGVDEDEVDVAVKGHMCRSWGWPEKPKGWDEWRWK